ncbi:unnamed protein product [Meloidogyne enterolobii]|uniref:Uncharacterized protein n=1 Tax=Meloidogyne enterolobii TaxID=390850 RepID=A0ACB0ZQG6_MELEN
MIIYKPHILIRMRITDLMLVIFVVKWMPILWKIKTKGKLQWSINRKLTKKILGEFIFMVKKTNQILYKMRLENVLVGSNLMCGKLTYI